MLRKGLLELAEPVFRSLCVVVPRAERRHGVPCAGAERTRDAVAVPHDEIKELLYLRLVPPSFLTNDAVDAQIMWRHSLGRTTDEGSEEAVQYLHAHLALAAFEHRSNPGAFGLTERAFNLGFLAPSSPRPPIADDSQRKFQDLFAQYFETCMKDWDTGTHMTKKEWSRTCRRLADQRAKFRLEKGFR